MHRKLLNVIALLLIVVGGFSQNAVHLKLDNQPLGKVLTEISEDYGIKISFDVDLLKEVFITDTIQEVSVQKAISKLLIGTSLKVNQINESYFAIVPSSKEWKIIGQVLDENDEAVPFAKLRIVGTYKGTYADGNGQYKMLLKQEEQPAIEISSLGFKSKIVYWDEAYDGKVSLDFDVEEFDEVIVEYLTEGITIGNDISHVTIRPKKIGVVPGTTEPDVFQVVQNVPGVNSASSSVSDIQIRGGTADQNQILWEDISIYHPGHFNGLISSINPNIIDRAEIHRGVYDPKFGGKTSGLIDMGSMDYIPMKLNGGAGVNMLQMDGYLKIPVSEKIGLLISGRRSLTDIWTTSPTYRQMSQRAFQESEIELDSDEDNDADSEGEFEPDFDSINSNQLSVNNEFLYSDFNAKLIYNLNEKTSFKSSFLYTQNRLDYQFSQPQDNEFTGYERVSRNLGVSASMKHVWGDKFVSELVTSYSTFSLNSSSSRGQDSIGGSADFYQSKVNEVGHLTFTLDNDWKLDSSQSLNFGVQSNLNEVIYDYDEFIYEDSITEQGYTNGGIQSIYANHIFSRGRFLSKIGVRGSYLSSTGASYFEPRIYQQYEVFTDFKIKGSFGIQNQFVSQVDEFEEVQTGLSNRIWVMASTNDEIPVMRSSLGSLGFNYVFKGWVFEAEGYYKDMKDIINFSNDGRLSSGFLRGDAVAIGIDLMVKKRWKNFRTWMSYTLSDVRYSFNDISDNSFAAPYNQRHVIKWVNVFNWRQFEFCSAFKIASGVPYSPAGSIVSFQEEAEEDEDEIETLYTLQIANPNSRMLPIFHQLDVSMMYKFPKNPEARLNGKFGVSFMNVYNKTNILSRTYELNEEYDINDNPIFSIDAVDRYYLKFTPNVILRIDF